jgi:riboflavin kinase/FMN adenylyltransferase
MKLQKRFAIAIGNFDGYHMGHQKLISTLQEKAAENKLATCLITFNPSPKVFFRPNMVQIFTLEQKKERLAQLGLNCVEYLNFIKYHQLSAHEFVKNVLIDQYAMDYIVVGRNFGFGRHRQGDIALLESLSKNLDFRLEVVSPLFYKHKRISSSRIRETLLHGDVYEAGCMLGNPYYIDGLIVEGDKLGRKLGFPTINVVTRNSILPEGVFESEVVVGGATHVAVTNIGRRPTFLGEKVTVESHILGFNKSVYGEPVRIALKQKLRNEVKFSSKEKLIQQIKKDIDKIKVDKIGLF